MLTKRFNTIIIIAGAVFLSACSSNQSAPTYMVAQAQETISQAKNSGASSSAPLALKNAEDNLRKAKKAMEKEEFKKAERYLETSLVESEYALVKSEADKSKKAAEQLQQSLETLRSETRYSN